MKRLAFYLSLALVVLALASCKGEGKSLITPASSGRPYEILVVADDDCWMSPDSALFHVLDTDVPISTPIQSIPFAKLPTKSYG